MHMQGLESTFQERGCARKAKRNNSSLMHVTERHPRLRDSRRIPPERREQYGEVIIPAHILKRHFPDAGHASAKAAWRLERGARTRPAPSPGPQPQGNAAPFTHRSPRDSPVSKQVRERESRALALYCRGARGARLTRRCQWPGCWLPSPGAPRRPSRGQRQPPCAAACSWWMARFSICSCAASVQHHRSFGESVT
jgi:hypothetical protein